MYYTEKALEFVISFYFMVIWIIFQLDNCLLSSILILALLERAVILLGYW